MSKQLDYNNLSDHDKEWLRSRGWGNRIPGEGKSDPTPGVVLDPNASAAEVLAQTPNTGTATFPANHGVTINEVNPEGYTEEDYSSWKVADLKSEVSDRNAVRDNEDDHIKPESSKKEDLVAALVADDQAHGEGTGEGDSGNTGDPGQQE